MLDHNNQLIIQTPLISSEEGQIMEPSVQQLRKMLKILIKTQGMDLISEDHLQVEIIRVPHLIHFRMIIVSNRLLKNKLLLKKLNSYLILYF